ncbi:MAG: hypothetical protein V1833_03935 [Elusimicrobiota bacterium]
MNKKLISYIGLTVGVVLVFFGGGLLYLKEKTVPCREKSPAIVVETSNKVQVIMSTSSVKTQTAVPVAKSSSTELKKSEKRKIAFRYRNSKPKTVFLVGDFNKWNKKANPMKQGQNFVWETMVLLSPGEYRYAFVVDGKRINDPNNKKTVRLKRGKASVLKVDKRQD